MRQLFTILSLLFCFCCQAQQKYKAVCITHPYDGDTPELIVNVFEDIYVVQKVRMYGINTPEIHGTDSCNAQEAQRVLDSLIYMKKLVLVPQEKQKDKYGRILATIFVGKLNVNEYMLKYGKAYFGGKKE